MRQELYLSMVISVILIISIVTASSSITGKTVSITGKAISGFSSFIDFVKSKISGKASNVQNLNLNITVLSAETPPQIIYVTTITDQSVAEGTEKKETGKGRVSVPDS